MLKSNVVCVVFWLWITSPFFNILKDTIPLGVPKKITPFNVRFIDPVNCVALL